jgi:hypothetical protein
MGILVKLSTQRQKKELNDKRQITLYVQDERYVVFTQR